MEILHAIAEMRSPFLDAVLGFITRLGEEEVVLIAICLVLWCIDKRFAFRAGMVFFASGLLVQLAKIGFRIERPWILDPTFQPVPEAMARATGYSLPSGHTQTGAALFGTMGAQFKKPYLKIICFTVVFLIAFSRMYLGVHTLQDVALSVVLTLTLVYIAYTIFPRNEEMARERIFTVALFLVIFAVMVLIFAGMLFSGNVISQPNLVDALKQAGAAIGFAVGMFIESHFIGFSVKCKNLAMQAVKFLVGIAGVMLIKEGIKLIPVVGENMITDTVRYFLMLMWIMAAYPLVIKKWFEVKEAKEAKQKLD